MVSSSRLPPQGRPCSPFCGKVLAYAILFWGLNTACQPAPLEKRPNVATLLANPLELQHAAELLGPKLGSPGKILELRVTEGELRVQAVDPAHPDLVLEHRWHPGGWEAPEVVLLRGDGRLADNSFPADWIPWTELPLLLHDAQQQRDATNGFVDLVLIRRDLPASREVLLRVRVDSPTRPAVLDYRLPLTTR